MSKAVSLLQNSYQHFVRISPTPLKNKRQNSAPDINHHFDMKQSTKRLTIQFSPQFCTATLLGPKFLLSALFSNTLNLSYLRFSPVALRPDAGSWPPLTGLHDNSLDTPHMVGLLRTSDRPYADLYLTTHSTHKRQTSMPPVGFAPAVPANERPQTHALDSAAAGTGTAPLLGHNIS